MSRRDRQDYLRIRRDPEMVLIAFLAVAMSAASVTALVLLGLSLFGVL